ncbi:MAG: phosphoribosyl-AMP cyclohydrolase [Alphaproteobacteria bacterium]|nr:MAG: phosphoribosyl-AMP cyclohydrolase [Alphaproteobacteria bacterium]
MPDAAPAFTPPGTAADVEEGLGLTPKFDAQGLIACVTTDAATGEVLMLAYMNAAALARTLETGQAHYWSRSRRALWHKGATSGQFQDVAEIRVDCDQDALWLKVHQRGGHACHTGRRSCFYRVVATAGADPSAAVLRFVED